MAFDVVVVHRLHGCPAGGVLCYDAVTVGCAEAVGQEEPLAECCDGGADSVGLLVVCNTATEAPLVAGAGEMTSLWRRKLLY